MLTDTTVRNTKPKGKQYRLSDGRGLALLVYPNGRRGWRFRYTFRGLEKMISLGSYPDVSLKKARKKRDEARTLLSDGIDPSAKRRAEKMAQADTFEAIAREWLNLSDRTATDTIDTMRRRLENYIFPYVGKMPINEISAPDLLMPLRRIESRGTYETAHRTRSACGRVFRYAIATGRAERDVAADLKGALAPVKAQNFAAITDPKRIGELLRAIDGYQGQPSVMFALRLASLFFVRPGELRAAEWTEFDLDAAEWRIPAPKTKMREHHIVPLSTQAVAIVKDLHPLTGDGRYLFPSLRTKERCISDNSINAALRRLGYSRKEHTAHGFRAMASTQLNELGWPPDVIERQLAHAERNKVKAAYNRAEHLAERRKMMQAWANYLDSLRDDKPNVVPIHG